jgi:SAM-dependent methyltransferase
LIEQVLRGGRHGLSAWREAQVRELAFWRWTALHGYAGRHPLLFPLFQEHLMVSTFYRTGWTMAEFHDAAVVELGCGPLGMIEYLPAARRLAFDPLNDKFDRLFAEFRQAGIEYVSDPEWFRQDETRFDLGICHNVIDHTDEPAAWFDTLFAKIRDGGRFIFQVNLSEPGTPQSEEHRHMHPSPLAFPQVIGWLQCKSADFAHSRDESPSADGEFYFLSWGTKTRDERVVYRRPLG